ncbi:MAG: ATP-binding protein [Methanoregula sp.]|nr:ATP-binding protein [Methanoregula sp.]
MAKNYAVEEVIPSAKRLINSLRDIGYDFPTAVAELVDNSIEADATEVSIKVEFDGENSWVMIADNGKGMSAEKLKEAMRYGSASIYNEKSLGKFGLGLKTASFSQSKHWLVATKSDFPDNDIISFKWDLDHVNRTDRWEILPIKKNSLDAVIKDYLQNKTGTVVFWQRIDRILEYENPNTERARKKLITMCRDLEEHLAMVFHRFLMGEVPGKKMRLFLNENEILPWDPYARNEKATKELDVIRIPLEHGGVHGEAVIEPYILPPSKAFSTYQAHSKAAGPKKWNQQQGFYIYRNDRMIQSGGWCRIRTYDEHTKLARFALNFSSKIDGAFKIDVSKMYVSLPPQIRKDIEDKTQSMVTRAREIYDNDEKTIPVIPSLDTFASPVVPSRKPNNPSVLPEIKKEIEEKIQPMVAQEKEIYDNDEKTFPVISSLDTKLDNPSVLPPQIKKEFEEKIQPMVEQVKEIYDNDEKTFPDISSLNTKPGNPSVPVTTQKISEIKIFPAVPSQIPASDTNNVTIVKASRPVIIHEEMRAVTEKRWTLDEILDELKKSAEPAEIHVLERVFSRLREQIQKT